jgi:hypothetical protein
MRDDATLFFSSKEELGLYMQITDGLKHVIKNKLENNFAEELKFKANMNRYLDQCTAFLHYLKSGNEDYGKTAEQLKRKYTMAPEDFNHDTVRYNNVVRYIQDERYKQMGRAMMFDNLFKQAMIFIDEVINDRDGLVARERGILLKEIDKMTREK